MVNNGTRASSQLEPTELVNIEEFSDVGRVSSQRKQTIELDEASFTGFDNPDLREGLPIASLSDRLAALSIDIIFLYAAYWFVALIYLALTSGDPTLPIPISNLDGLLLHSIFLLVSTTWFLFAETIFSASVGKFICNLRVVKRDGSPITLLAAIIRNILRPIDMLLCPIYLQCAMMEWGTFGQRLGDRLASTIVVRTKTRIPKKYALSIDILASASTRAIAFSLDLFLLSSLIVSCTLFLNEEHIVTSRLIVIFIPIIALMFFIIPEWIAKTTPGKWALGLVICGEDGSSLRVAQSMIRNLWRPFDCNPIGFLTCMLSLRKQRPGDLAASSVVIRTPRDLKGFITSFAMVLIVLFISFAALQGDGMMPGAKGFKYLPPLDIKIPYLKRSAVRPQMLAIPNFRIAAQEPELTRPASFVYPGEMLFVVFDVSGFQRKMGKVWLQEDISFFYPDDSLAFNQPLVSEFKEDAQGSDLVHFENQLQIPFDAQPGRYKIAITIRDMLSGESLPDQYFYFRVTYLVSPSQGNSTPQAHTETPKPTISEYPPTPADPVEIEAIHNTGGDADLEMDR